MLISERNKKEIKRFNYFVDSFRVKGSGNYQSLINDALRQYIQHIQQKREPLEERLRRVLREELKQIIK